MLLLLFVYNIPTISEVQSCDEEFASNSHSKSILWYCIPIVFGLIYFQLKYLLLLVFLYEDNLIILSFQYKVIF